jgi:hypothetical protein
MVKKDSINACLNVVKFPTLLWGSMTGAIYQRKVDTRDELLTRILGTLAHTKERRRSTQGKTNTIFAHELQSVLKLTVEFSKVYF